ncbi:MAG: ABC transporter permease subunit [Streptosporangiales bacterium]|nr:ABC transporter permease subunit [Streptosporangiales bacterium]
MTTDARTQGGWSRSKVLLRALPVVSVLVMVLLWTVVYRFTVFLPSPSEVTSAAIEIVSDPATYGPVLSSLVRLVIGIGVGMIAALLLCLAGMRSSFVQAMVRTYVRIAIVVPSLLLALLGLVILGTTTWSAVLIVAVLVFPFAAVPMQDGLRSLEGAHLEAAHVYRFGRARTIRHVVLPHMAPYVFSAIRNSHALGWKVLIVAEIFAVRSGIGHEFQRAFDLFDIARVAVWLIVFLAIIAVIEYGVLEIVERRVFRWRPGKHREQLVAAG